MAENQEVKKVYKSRPAMPRDWSQSPERENEHVSPHEPATVVIVEDGKKICIRFEMRGCSLILLSFLNRCESL